jgi:hypothetical protein
MDMFLQIVVDKAAVVNSTQLIMLLMIGVLGYGAVSACLWVSLQGVAGLRLKIYGIFMVRCLAICTSVLTGSKHSICD